MDLAELINTARGTRSFRELARASERGDAQLSAARWQQLAKADSRDGIRNFPDPATIRSIADTLGVSLRVVVLAAAESLGLEIDARDSPLHGMLPTGVRDLTDRQVLAVLAVVQAFLDPGLAQDQTDPDRFVLPDVTSPEPPHEPSAGDRTRPGSASGHGQ